MKKLLFAVFISFLSLTSCEKIPALNPKPTATIEFTESSNGSGTFTLNSANVTSAKWTFENKYIVDGLTANHTFSSNGNFTVSCEIKGNGGLTTVTKSIQITNLLGNIVFWQSDGKYNVQVTIENYIPYTITSNYSNTPTCSSTGVAIYTLPEGTYNFTAKTIQLFPSTWKGKVSVVGGVCSNLKLSN